MRGSAATADRAWRSVLLCRAFLQCIVYRRIDQRADVFIDLVHDTEPSFCIAIAVVGATRAKHRKQRDDITSKLKLQ